MTPDLASHLKSDTPLTLSLSAGELPEKCRSVLKSWNENMCRSREKLQAQDPETAEQHASRAVSLAFDQSYEPYHRVLLAESFLLLGRCRLDSGSVKSAEQALLFAEAVASELYHEHAPERAAVKIAQIELSALSGDLEGAVGELNAFHGALASHFQEDLPPALCRQFSAGTASLLRYSFRSDEVPEYVERLAAQNREFAAAAFGRSSVQYGISLELSADVAELLGDPERALEFLTEASVVHDGASDNQYSRIMLRDRLANQLLSHENSVAALRLVEEGTALFNGEPELAYSYGSLLECKARCHFELLEPEKAEEALGELLALYEEHPYSLPELSYRLTLFAKCFVARDDFEEAARVHEQAVEALESEADRFGDLLSDHALAASEYYQRAGLLNDAVRSGHRAVGAALLCSGAGSEEHVSALINLSRAFEDLGQFEDAEQRAEEAFDYSLAFDRKDERPNEYLVAALRAMTSARHGSGRHRDALDSAEELLREFEERDTPENRVEAARQKTICAELHHLLERPDEAERLVLEAIPELSQDGKYRFFQVNALAILADLKGERGAFESALENLDTARNLLRLSDTANPVAEPHLLCEMVELALRWREDDFAASEALEERIRQAPSLLDEAERHLNQLPEKVSEAYSGDKLRLRVDALREMLE